MRSLLLRNSLSTHAKPSLFFKKESEPPFFGKNQQNEEGQTVQLQSEAKPVKTEEATPTIIPSELNCTPKGMPRKQFLAQNGNDTSAFGQTIITATPEFLSSLTLVFKKVKGGVKLQPIGTGPIPTISSIYTQASKFDEGKTEYTIDSKECPRDHYTMRWQLDVSGANKIKQGELEHCSDYNYAYQKTVVALVSSVNKLLTRTFTSETKARNELKRMIHFDPDTCAERFNQMLENSKTLRDKVKGKDVYSWHRPRVGRFGIQGPFAKDGCSFVIIPITSLSFPDIGNHPTKDVVEQGLKP